MRTILFLALCIMMNGCEKNYDMYAEDGFEVLQTYNAEQTAEIFGEKISGNISDAVGSYCSVPDSFLDREIKSRQSGSQLIWLIGVKPIGVNDAGGLLCSKGAVDVGSCLLMIDCKRVHLIEKTPPFTFSDEGICTTE